MIIFSLIGPNIIWMRGFLFRGWSFEIVTHGGSNIFQKGKEFDSSFTRVEENFHMRSCPVPKTFAFIFLLHD